MHRCTRCSSPNVVANRLDDVIIERATEVARAVYGMGIPRVSAFAGFGAGALRFVNSQRKQYRCHDCGNKFDTEVDQQRHA
jgi:DNA-directed RNA polymerase subunit RPC12/RpoP